jgi:hypothetical protein
MSLFKKKIYFNRPNNLEDLGREFELKWNKSVVTLLSEVYKVSVSAKWLAGDNFNICVTFYC